MDPQGVALCSNNAYACDTDSNTGVASTETYGHDANSLFTSAVGCLVDIYKKWCSNDGKMCVDIRASHAGTFQMNGRSYHFTASNPTYGNCRIAVVSAESW
jgi:hypothetical protein